ncbi:MAG: mannitol dehydrogenase family protein [Pelagimonas sp.]|uniref:mannitol dehydrogenase family protein n=1 Tax=Pelagimonas sp. TaxID=2073170 RepID=UPI003D6C2F87
MPPETTSHRLTRQGDAPRIGIVHLGPGAFFRAFNAVYTQEAMEAQGGDWGICAVSLRSPTARDHMQPQGGCFTSVTLAETGGSDRVIGSVSEVLVAPENPGQVIARMSDPNVQIVSLTITEKGYCHNPATGDLNLDHPDIKHDLSAIQTPRSAVGFIVAALLDRRRNNTAPFTVLTCDNLPANGALMRGVVLDFARALDPDLADWIGQTVRFPSTMVDRITPATTDNDIDALAQRAGYHDPACVVHESFRQWVIEDDFVQGRPNWDAAGAQFVANVDAHELMKLRCLNGTHSALAYLGYLGGYETISDTVADPAFAAFCTALWREEITPTVPRPQGEDLEDYCATLLARYRDTAIRHKTWQIAMDGSQKLPQRLLGTIRDNLASGHVPKGLCLAVAAWLRYVGGVDEKGNDIDVRDPLAERLKTISDQAEDDTAKVAALLSVAEVFDPELAQNPGFRTSVTEAYCALVQNGAQNTLRSLQS